MRITNRMNLPQPLVSAIENDPYVKVGDVSATGLEKSPRQFWLEKEYWDEIEEDASERIWSLLGSVGHAVLERSNTDNHLHEERMTAEIAGWVLSGQPDLLAPDGTLYDYKFASVWAVKDAKPEWERQLNVYAWLYRQYGFEVKALRNVAILRDWSKRKAQREPDYPQVGVVVREVPLWPLVAQHQHIMDRIKLLQDAEFAANLPDCTPAERWQTPDVWAVRKEGNKRATKLFETLPEAEAFASEQTTNKVSMVIEARPGENVKCESYCNVAKFCNQYARVKAENEPT